MNVSLYTWHFSMYGKAFRSAFREAFRKRGLSSRLSVAQHVMGMRSVHLVCARCEGLAKARKSAFSANGFASAFAKGFAKIYKYIKLQKLQTIQQIRNMNYALYTYYIHNCITCISISISICLYLFSLYLSII